MGPLTIAGGSIPISQLIIQLVTAVGVGNFIVIMLVLALVVNAPSITNSIISFFKNRNASKQLEILQEQSNRVEQHINTLKENQHQNDKSLDVITNEVKALVAIVDIMHSSLDKENNERREENVVITSSLEKLSSALESIERMMRNVISEEDSAELVSTMLGIQTSLKHSILEKAFNTIDQLEDGDLDRTGLLTDIKNDIFSEWSDFKTKLKQFNLPINLNSFLEEKEKSLWSEDGLFTEITKIILTDNEKIQSSRKKTAITKRLNIGFRKLHSEITNLLHRDKYSQY